MLLSKSTVVPKAPPSLTATAPSSNEGGTNEGNGSLVSGLPKRNPNSSTASRRKPLRISFR